MTLNNSTTIPENATALTCYSCGHTGSDVKMHPCFIGGQGLVPIPECVDSIECWVRMGWGRICSFTEEYCPIGKPCLNCETLIKYKEVIV